MELTDTFLLRRFILRGRLYENLKEDRWRIKEMVFCDKEGVYCCPGFYSLKIFLCLLLCET